MELSLYGSIGWKHPFGIYQVIEWAKQFGWDSVDTRGMTLDIPGGRERQQTAFGYDMLGPRHMNPAARTQLREHCSESGISILCLYCAHPVNLDGELGQASRNQFKEFIDLSKELNIEWVRAINNTVASYADEPYSMAEAFEKTVAGLKEVGEYAAENNVSLLIENNENTTTSCADELLQMQNELQDVCRIGIAYDGTNAYFQALNPLDELQELDGCVDVLHVKNVRRHADTQFAYMPRGSSSYEWTSLEQGDLDWSVMLKLAIKGGFDGSITYEYVNPFKGMPLDYWNILPDPELAAKREADFLRETLADLGNNSE